MEQLLLVFYVVLSVAIVALILLQQGKGADAGASFGAGASQTVFGSGGSGNALTRGTAILSALFFVASVGLAMIAKDKADALRQGDIPIPELIEARDVPIAPDAPAVDQAVPAADSIPDAAASAPAASAADAPAAGTSDIPAASDSLPQ